MYAAAIKWALRAALVFAVGWAIWYTYDVVASAFRERREYQEKFTKATAEAAQASGERDAAKAQAERIAKETAAEIKARDAAVKTNADRARRATKELDNANRKMAEWAASADPDLARCLSLPLPDWLLTGSGEAPAIDLAPVLPPTAHPAR